ncbi:MAG: hypothetical protein B7Z02_03920 [Rhodobacterales bacterium 32-67-9]|nr:MAG: hypothetical protein B7Z02_03920 [Rhodobacterales bacterium 32-67-9]
MTPFEKANIKQIAVVALLLAAAIAFLPFSAQLYVVPICFSWGGAIVLWMVLSDRNGRPKSQEVPTFGEFLLPVFAGHLAALVLFTAAGVGALAKQVWE